MLIYGSAYTYGTLIPYVTSFLYYSGDSEITTNKMSSLLLISILVLNFGMPLCNIKQLQFSNRVTTLLSISGVCLSIFAISFCDQFWHYLVIYGILFGLFIGFGYLAPIKNCYQHIPHLKGTAPRKRPMQRGLHPRLRHLLPAVQLHPARTHQPRQRIPALTARRTQDLLVGRGR
jgi:hypothetical protein